MVDTIILIVEACFTLVNWERELHYVEKMLSYKPYSAYKAVGQVVNVLAGAPGL